MYVSSSCPSIDLISWMMLMMLTYITVLGEEMKRSAERKNNQRKFAWKEVTWIYLHCYFLRAKTSKLFNVTIVEWIDRKGKKYETYSISYSNSKPMWQYFFQNLLQKLEYISSFITFVSFPLFPIQIGILQFSLFDRLPDIDAKKA